MVNVCSAVITPSRCLIASPVSEEGNESSVQVTLCVWRFASSLPLLCVSDHPSGRIGVVLEDSRTQSEPAEIMRAAVLMKLLFQTNNSSLTAALEQTIAGGVV